MLTLNKSTFFATSFLSMLFVSSLLISCSSSETEPQEDPLAMENKKEIVLTKNQFESSDMLLGKLEKHSFNQSIKSYGVIDVPPENKASISAYFGGYVKKLSLLEGQYVEKGQLLFTLENPEYIEIQQNFLEAKDQLNYLKSDYERQKILVQDNVSSQKTYLKAEADYKVTLVRFESLKKKLDLMNLDPDNLNETNIRSEISLTAPISGNISQIHASRGMYLNPDDIALTIINSDHIHLELSIFEKDLPKIKAGQEIHFKLQNDATKDYVAEVHLVGNYIDPESRTASLHGHLANEKESKYFTPGMYIEAEIFSSSDTLIALPESAIVKLRENNFVLLKTRSSEDQLSFEKREVVIGQSKNGYSEILNSSDFAGDDEFLVKGAFNLITE